MNISWLLLFQTLCLYQGFQSIKLTNFYIPPYKQQGDDVVLTCEYDLEGQSLYAIKWYRGDNEFLRFLHSKGPRPQVFLQSGINVDINVSNGKHVVLRSVTPSTSGVYRCEVSCEGPSFKSVSYQNQMTVVVLPNPPVITGQPQNSKPDEVINVNCTSHNAKPAASIEWYINDKKVKPDYHVEYVPTMNLYGLETSTLGLKFKLKSQHINEGKVVLNCTASISEIYWESQVAVITIDDEIIATMMESKRTSGQTIMESQNKLTVLIITTLVLWNL